MKVVKCINGDEVITYNGVESIRLDVSSGLVVLTICDGRKSYLYLSKCSGLLVSNDG